MIEKAGGILGSDKLAEKGRQKRDGAGGYGDDGTGNN
jgi:hypothetical protein